MNQKPAIPMRLLAGLCLPLLLLLLAACGSASETGSPPESAAAPGSATIPPTHTGTPSPAPSATASPTGTPTPTATQTASPTPTPTEIPSPTPIPTYVKLRGKVIIDQAVCHYGPGAPYLYKYGVYKGSNLEIIRRVAPGNYVEVQAIGGTNPCWLKVDYLEIKDDLSLVEPVDAADVKLPISPYYRSPTGVAAVREGDEVIITWHPVVLRPGDDQGAAPYVVEVWVCQEGEYRFIPIGAYRPLAKVVDQPGCDQPSRGFLAAAEKHGYMPRVEIPWPP